MLGLTAACGGDRTVAPAAPSVSTAELPPGTIRREYTPPEQVGLWSRSDSLSAQQGMERAKRQDHRLTTAQRRELLANPMLDDYPVLRMAMTIDADLSALGRPSALHTIPASILTMSCNGSLASRASSSEDCMNSYANAFLAGVGAIATLEWLGGKAAGFLGQAITSGSTWAAAGAAAAYVTAGAVVAATPDTAYTAYQCSKGKAAVFSPSETPVSKPSAIRFSIAPVPKRPVFLA